MGKRVELQPGQKFGRLTLLWSEKLSSHHTLWHCKCECGQETAKYQHHILRNVEIASCGCRAREIYATRPSHVKHGWAAGRTRTPEYLAWRAMLTRCYTVTNKAYSNYGGRGISVCDRWRTSFENFLSDMGARPSPRHSLDRIDNNGNYDPDNCRWATFDIQSNNKRQTKLLTFNGRTLSATQWARELGWQPSIILNRLRSGWSVERAITTPPNLRKSRSLRSSEAFKLRVSTGFNFKGSTSCPPPT